MSQRKRVVLNRPHAMQHCQNGMLLVQALSL